MAPVLDDAQRAFPDLPGVLGPKALTVLFAEEWARRTGQSSQLTVAERIYELTSVRSVTGVPGRMRKVREHDRPLVIDWLTAFHGEALPAGNEAPGEWARRMVEHRLQGDRDTGFVLWEDGTPVSLAGYIGRTPSGIRDGPVYTPPMYRRRGYASALIAEVSHMWLSMGCQRCFLFTDLANPTSNKIYQAVGYAPVTDVDVVRFSGPKTPGAHGRPGGQESRRP